MAAGELQASRMPPRRSVSLLGTAGALIIFAGVTLGVVVSPAVMQKIYVNDDDYSRIADVGQAYGGAAAVVACVALFIVAASVGMQYHQAKEAQRDAHAEYSEELVRLAMENPKYRQCWGARVSPEGMDEDLFYYCSKLIKCWTRAWELNKIDEAQARQYLANFFDSEVPRRFWEMHGDWHRRGAQRGRREEFRDLVNDEYLLAVRSGPPARVHESFDSAPQSSGVVGGESQ